MAGEGKGVSNVFPESVARLPEADIPFDGVGAYISQGDDHQVLFMEFEKDVEVATHSHRSQWAVVLEGRIDLVIGGIQRTYGRGDRYFIPDGVEHSARVHAGYADVTFFEDRDRYRPKR